MDKAIGWTQQRAGFHFAPEQSAALQTTLSSKISILTGGPGTRQNYHAKSIIRLSSLLRE